MPPNHFQLHLKIGTHKITYDVDEIIPFHYFCPIRDFLGQGSPEAAKNSLILEQESNASNKAFFANDATPSGVIESSDELGEEEYERLLTQWNARHRGSKSRFKTAILPPGLSFKPTGMKLH